MQRLNHTYLMILFAILTAWCKVSAQSSSNGLPAGFSVLPDYPFVIIADFGVNDDLQLSDSLFNALAVGVQFKVNRTDIDPESSFRQLYGQQVLPLLFGSHLKLHKLFIRGAASPEGPYDNNRRLGVGRSKALFDFIGKDLQRAFGDGKPLKTDAQTITEDYGYLIDLMREANDPDYETVRSLFEQARHNELQTKSLLQRAQGGKLWTRLKEQYFERLRTARIVLLVSRIQPQLPDLSIKSQPRDLSYSALPPRPVELSLGTVQPHWEPDTVRRHLVALRTNLLRDGFYMPQFGWAPGIDAQLEYYPLDGHYTYNAAFTWTNHRHWSSQEFFQMRDLQLELRRYFRGGGEFLGAYLGAYLEGTVYGIGLSKTKGWEGEGGGAGLSVGYVMPLNRRGNWRLEFMASFGAFVTRYDPYVYGNPVTKEEDGDYYYDYLGSATAFKERNHQFTWFGPTNVGIQITYDILYRKPRQVKKGDAR